MLVLRGGATPRVAKDARLASGDTSDATKHSRNGRLGSPFIGSVTNIVTVAIVPSIKFDVITWRPLDRTPRDKEVQNNPISS